MLTTNLISLYQKVRIKLNQCFPAFQKSINFKIGLTQQIDFFICEKSGKNLFCQKWAG